jgi:hypothetical protein
MMGESRRRKQQLGKLYGTPEGSNSRLFVYRDADQHKLDVEALRRIRAAQSAGHQVTLVGTSAAKPLAEAAGLPWLHEISAVDPIPASFAWDPVIAELGGPLLPDVDCGNRVVILGAGSTQWMAAALDDEG